MRSYLVGLDVFLNYHTLCMRAAKALARLCDCLNMHAQLSSHSRCIPLLPYLVYASSEGSGETVRMHRLV